MASSAFVAAAQPNCSHLFAVPLHAFICGQALAGVVPYRYAVLFHDAAF